MTWFNILLNNQRFVLSLTLMLTLLGIASYNSMSRQEDPSFPYRPAIIQAIYPGATAPQVQKLVVEPLEEELAQVEELRFVKSVARDNVAIFNMQLNDTIYDTDAAWDRVRRAMERAENFLPAGVTKLELKDRLMDSPAVVLSIFGSDDVLQLADAAQELKRQLLHINKVSRIEINGLPEKELIVATDDTQLHQLGLNRQAIVAAIKQKNQLIPGGLINVGDKYIRLNPASDLNSLEEFKRIPINMANGQTIPLGAIASISLQAKSPAAAQSYHKGQRSISIGIFSQRGQTDAVKFGQQIREKLSELSPSYLPLKIEESFFQPDYVEERLTQLQLNLLVSASIIALVICLALGWRIGLLISIVLPVVALITLAIYNLGGGIMHQIAVIGIVISLGILIDNAIVVIESIQSNLRDGMDQLNAAKEAAQQLAMPLFASTGTTVAAFLPLLLSKGGTGDFTRAIPVMIIIALVTSYLISVFVLPLIARYTLPKIDTSKSQPQSSPTQRLSKGIISILQSKPFTPLFIVALLLMSSVVLVPFLKMSFFPATDRAQIVVDLELPAGSALEKTEEISKHIEQLLIDRDDVDSVTRSVGMSGFSFFYNLTTTQSAPNRARLMVNTSSGDANETVVSWLEHDIQPTLPGLMIVAKKLGQGPPIPAPIVLHLQSDDRALLFEATHTALSILHNINGTRMIRSNLDLGLPELSLDINDYTAESFNLNRSIIAAEIFAQTQGLDSGDFLYTDDPVDIKVRSSQGEYTAPTTILSLPIYNNTQAIPLASVSKVTSRWSVAEFNNYKFRPTVTLLSELQPGAAFNQVLAEFFQQIESNPLPSGVEVLVGGEAEGSGDANQAVLQTAPFGVGVLLFFMMLQFNSFRRIGIILCTIPLAAIGILPGLVFSGQPFGFQSLLGVISLIGIVVNNAIVLIDVVDKKLKAGNTVADSVYAAIRQRTSPILLTTATTILGLLPLAFSSSTLWPPMAWPIISGLAMSTMLTLFVIPSLCLLLLKPKVLIKPEDNASETDITHSDNPLMTGKNALTLLLGGVLTLSIVLSDNRALADDSSPSQPPAQHSVDGSFAFNSALMAASKNQSLAAQKQTTLAGRMEWENSKRQAFFPKLALKGSHNWRDENSVISLPTGNLVGTEKKSYVVEGSIEQPLFALSGQRYGVATAKKAYEAEELKEASTLLDLGYAVVVNYTAILKLQNNLAAQQQLKSALEQREQQTQRQFDEGLRLYSDVLQVTVAKNNSLSIIAEIQQQLAIQTLRLKQLVQTDFGSSDTLENIQPQLSELVRKAGIENALNNRDELTLTQSGILTLNNCEAHPKCAPVAAQLGLFNSRIKAANTTRLPEFNLALKKTRSDGSVFIDDSDAYLALNMSWQPYSGGSTTKEKRGLAAQKQAVLLQLNQLAESIAIEQEQAKASWRVALAQKELAKSSLKASAERIRIITKRYEQGLHTLDDLLDAEAAFSRDTALSKNANLDLLEASAAWLNASGQGYNVWLQP